MYKHPVAETKIVSWFKAVRSTEALELIKANPNAFILAYFIANRARYRDRAQSARILVLDDVGLSAGGRDELPKRWCSMRASLVTPRPRGQNA